MYADHSGELIPIIAACAPSCQRPPRSFASCSRTSSQTCSESTMTPSMSKTTASIMRAGSRRRDAAAAACRRRARRARRDPGRTCGLPAASSSPSSHSSQPTAPSRSGPRLLSRTPSPCHIAIGGTPRAKCCASSSWSPASSETAKPPASRSSSWNAAWRATEIPTNGGSSASETSEDSVRPRRVPSTSTVATATPTGYRRMTALNCSPLDTARCYGRLRKALVGVACGPLQGFSRDEHPLPRVLILRKKLRRPCRAGRRPGTASASRASAGRRPCRRRRVRRPPSRCPAGHPGR